MRRTLLLLALPACFESASSPGVSGSERDVRTLPGDYAGYRVVRPCPEAYRDIGVLGLGAVVPDDNDEIAALGSELWLDLGDVQSVWGGGGVGLGCEPGVGTIVYLDDWRDVDRVIDRAGAFLVERDLAMEVGISVESIPVAH
jgi:hypothetical protein